jgi:hypothetical protein
MTIIAGCWPCSRIYASRVERSRSHGCDLVKTLELAAARALGSVRAPIHETGARAAPIETEQMWEGWAMGSDVLARVRAEIDARLLELRHAVAEYARLLDAERALAADAAAADASAAAVKAARPAKAARPVKAARPPQAARPAKAARPTRPARPAKAARPANAASPAKAAPPVRVARPAKAAPAKAVRPATSPKRRGKRGSAVGAIKRAASSSHDASQQAIVAALEHGSHTLGELVLVTAIAASELRQGVRHLQHAGTITRTKREGRAAYALASASTG